MGERAWGLYVVALFGRERRVGTYQGLRRRRNLPPVIYPGGFIRLLATSHRPTMEQTIFLLHHIHGYTDTQTHTDDTHRHHLPTWIHPPTYLPTCPPIIPTYIPTHPPTYPPTYMHDDDPWMTRMGRMMMRAYACLPAFLPSHRIGGGILPIYPYPWAMPI